MSAATSGYVVNHNNNQKAARDFQRLRQEAEKLHIEIAQLQKKNEQLQALPGIKGAYNSNSHAIDQQSSIASRKEPQHFPRK